MSFALNFTSRLLFFEQAYEKTNHRWVTFEKIWRDGFRVGMRMKKRIEPHEVMAEAFVDGTIILYAGFYEVDNRVKREIYAAIDKVAILVKEDKEGDEFRPSKLIYQRKRMYTSTGDLSGIQDFSDFLTQKFLPGSQSGVQSSRRI